MEHFLLYTGPGLLVLTTAASAVVAVVVWYAVTLAVAATAWVCWRACRAVNGQPRPRTAYSPRTRA